MTIALYRINFLDTRYEYTINGLIGKYNAPVLSDVLTYIIDNDTLIYSNLQDLPAYYDGVLTKSELVPIFTATYHDFEELRSLLYNDVHASIPELLI